MSGVLDGVLVLDFSTLLPGPLASLMLAEAGARVIKVERPPRGDPMRSYAPKADGDGVNFHMLNRGKESLAIDLKDPTAIETLKPLIAEADVLLEQFRPGVMARLGLGYAALKTINPGLVYCSITGYGQKGPLADRAGHDLNYLAETGCLGLSGDAEGNPVLPPILSADIAGGTYPAIINILLALMRRDKTGEGCHIDVAMADNLFPFLYWGLGEGFGAGSWPKRSQALVTGGSPRYAVYRAKDGRHIAVGAIEEPFWRAFAEAIGLSPEEADDAKEPARVKERVAALIAARDAVEWERAFRGRDVCAGLVKSVEEAAKGDAFRRLFARDKVAAGETEMPALPVPIAPEFRDGAQVKSAPKLRAFREKP